MDSNEAVEHLATIRKIMESATKLTVLPGRAAIAGGVLALVGSVISYRLLGGLSFGAAATMSARQQCAVAGLWMGVALIAVVVDILFTVRLAKKQGRSPWSRMGQLAAYTMGPAVLVASALTVSLTDHGLWEPLPAIWMMLYGVAVWMSSLLSTRAPGLLGLFFLFAGFATLMWAGPVALVMVALTFGAAHIVYGIYLLKRFGE